MRLSINEATKLTAAALGIFAILLVFQTRSHAAGTTVIDAAVTYKAKCASCHGADGSGSTAAGKALKARDLRSAEVQGQSDAQLFAIIAKGKGKMPAYEKTLGADTCKALVAHVRTLKQ